MGEGRGGREKGREREGMKGKGDMYEWDYGKVYEEEVSVRW